MKMNLNRNLPLLLFFHLVHLFWICLFGCCILIMYWIYLLFFSFAVMCILQMCFFMSTIRLTLCHLLDLIIVLRKEVVTLLVLSLLSSHRRKDGGIYSLLLHLFGQQRRNLFLFLALMRVQKSFELKLTFFSDLTVY